MKTTASAEAWAIVVLMCVLTSALACSAQDSTSSNAEDPPQEATHLQGPPNALAPQERTNVDMTFTFDLKTQGFSLTDCLPKEAPNGMGVSCRVSNQSAEDVRLSYTFEYTTGQNKHELGSGTTTIEAGALHEMTIPVDTDAFAKAARGTDGNLRVTFYQ